MVRETHGTLGIFMAHSPVSRRRIAFTGFQTKDRLHLADAVAALYVSSPSATHPSREDVIEFLSSTPAVSESATNLLME